MGVSRSFEEEFGRVWGLLAALGQHVGSLGQALGIFGFCKATADPLQVSGKMTVQPDVCASHYQHPAALTAAVSVVAQLRQPELSG